MLESQPGHRLWSIEEGVRGDRHSVYGTVNFPIIGRVFTACLSAFC